MIALILVKVGLLTGIALVGQLIATLIFTREAILTKEGTFCRIKCMLAAAMYGTVAALLALYFFC